MANFTNAEIVNSIRSGASAQYQNGIPVAITGNASEVGNLLLSDANVPSLNEFSDILVNKFAKVSIDTSRVYNRFDFAYRGALPFGMTVQEIFVNQAKNTGSGSTAVTRVRDFDGNGGATTFFEKDIPDIRAMYYEMNRSKQYDTYFNRTMLKAAFANENGLAGLIGAITDSIVKGNTQDEYVFCKQLLSDYAGTGSSIQGYKVYNSPAFAAADTDANKQTKAKSLISTLRGAALDMTFNSSAYNGAGVDTLLTFDDMVLLLHKDVAKIVDVYELANAFNLGKVDWLSNPIYVDDFGTNTLMSNCLALLIDKQFLNIYDNERVMTSQWFPNDLQQTLWYTVRQTGYCNPFKNAVAVIGTTASAG